MYYLIYVVVIALVLVIDYLIARAFQDIAIMKGHNDGKYFWISFLLGFVGYLMVIALPDLKARPPKPERAPLPEEDKKIPERKEESVKETSNLLDIFKKDNTEN